jgi:glycosyltransferase involved in cell wall biosynthesis
MPELPCQLESVEGAVWLLRAGAWPAADARIRLPPSSATGLPVLARGRPNDLNSLYLEPPLVIAFAENLRRGLSFELALDAVEQQQRPRSIVFPPLLVQFDPRLRVLQVITSLQRGGAERIALDLATELHKRGVTCQIATTCAPTRESFVVPSERHLDLSQISGGRAARAEKLREKAIEFGADVIHAHLLHGEEVAILAQRGLPLVITVHNQRPGWPPGLEQLPREAAALLAACSTTVERELRAAGLQPPIRTVWNGINFDAAKPSSEVKRRARELRQSVGWRRNDFILLSLANPRPQKRLDRLPAVLAATRASFAAAGIEREARLWLCGEHVQGNLAALDAVAQTIAEVERLKLGEHVRWLGSVADVATVLAASDALVSTSAFEGLSLAQLEALAAGMPIVISDVGGAQDVAVGNPAVTVLPENASPEAYADRLLEVAKKRPAGGAEAARRNFTHWHMTERYQRLYPRAIATQQRKQGGNGLWLLTNNFSTGGAQSSARRLLLALHQQGIPVRAALLQEQPQYPTPGREKLEEAGIRVLALPPAGEIDPAQTVAQLLSEIDLDSPAAVLCWNALTEHKLLLAEGLLDIPLFDVSPGEMYFSSLERYFQRPRPALPYRTPTDYGRRLAGAIVKYAAEAEQARRTLGCPVYVVPNGLDLSFFVPRRIDERQPERLLIGTSARLSPQKKLEELLAALRKAHPRMPKYVLQIAGGAERESEAYAANLRRLAYGLPVEWVGGLTDVREFLSRLDLFVMISEPAGCPNASLEALAAGLPVVATDFGGAREQIEPGVSGLLTPRGDATALADAIVAAARDPALRARLAANGRRRVEERFSLERMVADYLAICLPEDAARADRRGRDEAGRAFAR